MKWDEMWNEIQIFALIELIVLIALNGQPVLSLSLLPLLRLMDNLSYQYYSYYCACSSKWETSPIIELIELIALVQLNGKPLLLLSLFSLMGPINGKWDY